MFKIGKAFFRRFGLRLRPEELCVCHGAPYLRVSTTRWDGFEAIMVLGYWVELIDEGQDRPARPLLGLSSAVEAAGIYAQSLVEESQGAWTEGAIRVWNKDQGRENATIFDVSAHFTPSCDEDAEEGDLDCELEIIERL